MKHRPVYSKKHCLLRIERGMLLCTVFTATLLLALALACYSAPQPAKPAAKMAPDVLVLVLGVMGPDDMASVNYTTIVPQATTQADLDKMAAVGGWTVKDASQSNKADRTPGSVPTSSVTFRAQGMVGQQDGTLPLTPYIDALKRFKHIEIQFITPSTFKFQGLKDFENDFVKISMSPAGSTYRYKVLVKDNSFTKLDIPLKQPEKPKQSEQSTPLAARAIMIISIALLGAIVAYVATAYITKRK